MSSSGEGDAESTVEGLRHALRSFAESSSLDGANDRRRAVRDAVSAFVEDERSEGAAPEEIVVAVRAISAGAGVPCSARIVCDSVVWATNHYFGAQLND